MSSLRHPASSVKGASPSTQSTDVDNDDTFSAVTDPAMFTNHSIALSVQDSECSFSSEYTEDTFAFSNIVESIRAEFTGDYSHFDRQQRQYSRDDDESVYTEFSQHLDESSTSSSFPRDDASPRIHVVPPAAAKTRYSESPSREMRRMVYSGSKSKENLSYSRSPPVPPQSLSFRSRTAPARSSFASPPLNATSSFHSSRASRDWDSNKENTRYDDEKTQESTHSSSRMKGPDTPDEPLKQTSPSIRQERDTAPPVVTPCRSTASVRNELHTSSPRELQQRDLGFGDLPFDEIDFFDWNSVQVKPKERSSQHDSPLLDEPQSPFDESPKKTPSPSIIVPPCERSTTRSSPTVAERVKARHAGESTKTPTLQEANPSFFAERSPLGSTPSTSLLSKFDSVDTSGIDSTRRNGLTRSTSYKEKRESVSRRTSKMERSESFTFGTNRTDLSRASLDDVDMLSPTVLSFDRNNTTNQQTGKRTPTKSMHSAKEDSSSEQLDSSFPFSKPNTPTLTPEEIEVVLSDPNFSFESSGRHGLSRSQSWKEKRSVPSSRPSLKKSVSFTLGSKRNTHEKEQRLQFTPAKTMPSIDETTCTPTEAKHQALVLFSSNSSESKLPSRSEPPKSRGLSRSQSWRPKVGRLSRPSLTKRSESFKHYGKVGELQFDSLLTSSTPPSVDEIEVALQTPAPHHHRGRKKKIEVMESQSMKSLSSPATVFDFPTTIEFSPETLTEPKNGGSKNTAEMVGLGKRLGKNICRVGNRISCRSTAQDSESFDRCDSTVPEEHVTPSLDDKRVVRSAVIHQSDACCKESVECMPAKMQTEPEASQKSVAFSRTSDTFDDGLDDLLEKVGSLAISAPPSPTDEEENEASSSTIIDAVINFQL